LALSFNSIFIFFLTEAARYDCSYRRTTHWWHEGLKKCKEAKGKVMGFVDGSHEWGREGSGACGKAVVEENGVSESSQHGMKRRGGL